MSATCSKCGYDERKKVYIQAIETYGAAKQLMMAVEEMAELTQAICKRMRVPAYIKPDDTVISSIAEETADVTIMLEQLRLILDIDDKILEQMDYKTKRLAERLEKERENKK